jgi:DNA-binding NarL/FixJ family response regulator
VSSTQPAGVLITYSGRAHSAGVMAIVADRRLSVAALSALLLKDPAYRITREEEGLNDVRAMLAARRPQVMVLDVSGPALISLIDASAWGVQTLLLLDADDDGVVLAAAAGTRVEGYLSRSATREKLEAAIEVLDRSGSYVDPLLAAAPTLTLPTRARDNSGLSVREREILVWVASGRSTKEIARECAIAPKTVANHVSNMSQKLNFRHRGQLVLYAAQQGLTAI